MTPARFMNTTSSAVSSTGQTSRIPTEAPRSPVVEVLAEGPLVTPHVMTEDRPKNITLSDSRGGPGFNPYSDYSPLVGIRIAGALGAMFILCTVHVTLRRRFSCSKLKDEVKDWSEEKLESGAKREYVFTENGSENQVRYIQGHSVLCPVREEPAHCSMDNAETIQEKDNPLERSRTTEVTKKI